jgi:hypothetical protein
MEMIAVCPELVSVLKKKVESQMLSKECPRFSVFPFPKQAEEEKPS